MKVFSFLLGLIFLAGAGAAAGEVSLTPAAIVNGGVALLCWEGETPVSATARWNDRRIFLSPTSTGACALLGADLELPAGVYPVSLAVIGRHGDVEYHDLFLRVAHKERPTERLSLPPGKDVQDDPEVLRQVTDERRMLDELFGVETVPAVWETFERPVNGPISSLFGFKRVINGEPRSPHAGVDFRSPRGNPVKATATGRVVLAGDLFFTGLTVILDHGEGLFSIYAHLESLECYIGQTLDGGAVLGRVGSSGRATGPHLHWGVKLRGDRIDPIALLQLFSGQKD